MSVGWIYFFSSLIINLGEDHSEQHVSICCILQLIACLELIHVLLNLVKGSLFATIAQLVGRNHILFCGIYCFPELWKTEAINWLFIFWASIEIVRYPNYTFSLYNIPGVKILQWLRYTIFIPLYPLGFGTERKKFCFLVDKY